MMILHSNAMGLIPKESSNPLKDTYQQNHHMLLAQAKAMKLCHDMFPSAKIGPAPNISTVYPASSKPEDITASQNWNAIRNWLYLDMAVYGRYNNIAWSYLEEKNALPDISEGDMEILASGKPDFIAFNYYSTATVEASIIGEKAGNSVGDQQIVIGDEGVYKGASNPNLQKTEFGWEIDPIGFRNTLRDIYERYALPLIVTENGLGAFDKIEEDGTIKDDYRIDFDNKGNIKKEESLITLQNASLDKNPVYKKGDKNYFGVPVNIYFLGTMNDIDRSVDSFDMALRRRFFWKEIRCNYDYIDSLFDNKGYRNICEELNEYITGYSKEKLNGNFTKVDKIKEKETLKLGTSYELGHAYFKNIKAGD